MTLWNMVIMRMKCDYIQLWHGKIKSSWPKDVHWKRFEIKENLQSIIKKVRILLKTYGEDTSMLVFCILTLWKSKTYWPDVSLEVTFTLISHENGDSNQYKLINGCVVYSTQSVILKSFQKHNKKCWRRHTSDHYEWKWMRNLTRTHSDNDRKHTRINQCKETHVHALTFLFNLKVHIVDIHIWMM